MNKSREPIWKRGTMKFIIDLSFMDKHTYISKEGENPSKFLARVLRKAKEINGESVFIYLYKKELNDWVEKLKKLEEMVEVKK